MRRATSLTAALHLGAGALFGLAFVDPAWAVAAWGAIACQAFALARSRSVVAVLLLTFAAQCLARAIAFPWVPEMNATTFGYAGSEATTLLIAEWAIWSVSTAVSVAALFGLLRRRIAVFLWLPVAWALAEWARFHILSLRLDDWLATQWTVGPVLRGLGHLGWYPVLFACLAAAAAVGEAAARRTWRRAALLPAVLLGLALLPPLAPHGERLAGIGAVHTTSTVEFPHRPAEPAIDLVVWPEAAQAQSTVLPEGSPGGARLRPLIPGTDAVHLVGLETRLPTGARQNQVVAVDPEGAVLTSRAKHLLFPIAERRLLGWGTDRFRAGAAQPLFEVASRSVVPLICGEVMSRALVAEGVAAGGEVLAVLARDQMMQGDRPLRQLLAVQVLRSVEFGVPSVRGSYGGWAYFVSASGEVLARSGRTRNGTLLWDPARGARDVDYWGDPIDETPAPPRPAPTVAVLYDRAHRSLRTQCPEGRCRYHALDGFACPADAQTSAVVVAGHGAPPDYLSQPAEAVAAAIRCFNPEVIVLDVCYGASSTLLTHLADLDAVVVAAPSMVPGDGFDYGPAFFTPSAPEQRAAAVRFPHDGALLRGRVDRAGVDAALARVAAMSATDLDRHLARRVPAQVRVDLAGAGPLLVPFDWARMGKSGRRASIRKVLTRMRARRKRFTRQR